jgi:ankyrin repeat protein
MVELLMEFRVELDTKDDASWTPLHSSASAGHANIAHLLVQKHAQLIDRTNSAGATALHYGKLGFVEKICLFNVICVFSCQ